MPPELAVRPAAAFRGLRYLPLIAVSHNSLYPSLKIGAGGVTLRVIRRHHLRFEEIEAVDLRWRLAHQVTIIPKKGPWTLCANFLDRVAAQSVLGALDAGDVALSPRARAFLATAEPRRQSSRTQ